MVKSGAGWVFAGRVPPLGAMGLAAGTLRWGGGSEEMSENCRINLGLGRGKKTLKIIKSDCKRRGRLLKSGLLKVLQILTNVAFHRGFSPIAVTVGVWLVGPWVLFWF